MGIDSDSIAQQRRELSAARKRAAKEEAACLQGILVLVVLGYFVGKAFR
jgi:hypothetical protein